MKVFLYVFVATILEAVGDAVVRIALHHPPAPVRVSLFLLGALFLFGYGTTLNLAPVEFSTVTGIYVATLFVVFQVSNYAFFKQTPSSGILAGGALIVAGGVVVSVWR